MNASELLKGLRPSQRAAVLAQMHIKQRKPAVDVPVDPYRSDAERAYARQLAIRQLAGEIVYWRHEPLKIRLADKTTYKPDFLVVYPDGTHELVEVKGFEREDDRIKFNTAAELLPSFRFVMVRKSGDGWDVLRRSNVQPIGRVRT